MLQNVQEGTKPKAYDKRDRKSHGEVEQAKQQTPRPPEHRRQKSRERRYRYKNARNQSAMHGCSRATWSKIPCACMGRNQLLVACAVIVITTRCTALNF
jgi:hypothetical protein